MSTAAAEFPGQVRRSAVDALAWLRDDDPGRYRRIVDAFGGDPIAAAEALAFAVVSAARGDDPRAIRAALDRPDRAAGPEGA